MTTVRNRHLFFYPSKYNNIYSKRYCHNYKCTETAISLLIMFLVLMNELLWRVEAMEHQNTLLDEISISDSNQTQNRPHSRQKRLIWITDDGRLALPPGTTLTITPSIGLPLVRHPPEGFLSNISISFPVTIDFDKLGLTDNQNPLGDIPPLLSRSFSHSAGRLLGNYVAEYLLHRSKRDLNSNEYQQSTKLPQLPERLQHIFHGGERVILYTVLEDMLSNFGMDGKACLLRTICEVHSRDISHYGLFGEIAKLFLTVSNSPFSDQVPEYLLAQEIGEGRQPPHECFPYYKNCPKSIFRSIKNNKYRENLAESNDMKNNEIQYTMSI